MSDPNLARRTAVEIAFNGVDITGPIGPHLESVTYTDNEADEADDIQIQVHDRESVWLEQWLNDALEAAASGEGAASSSTTKSYRVTPKIGLNVRAGPGTGYKKLGALTCGTTVEVSAIENGWATIDYGGRTAYVCASYIKEIGTDSNAGAAASGTGEAVYTVVKGDTLSGIAARYGSTWRKLAEYNSITDPNLIFPGQRIKIPGAGGPSANSGGPAPAAASDGFSLQAVIVQKNWNGDGKDKVLDCGQCELDSVTAFGPPAVISIKGTSLPFSTPVRQTKKSKVWVSRTLSSIVNEIAMANGMVCMYESALDPFYSRVEQIKTSDIQFLRTLCHNAGISLKATNRILVLFDQAAYESKAAVFTIKRGSGVYTKYKLNVGTADTQYSTCRVSYVDPTGKCIEGIARVEDYNEKAKNNQQLEITAKVADKAEAKTLAAKLLRKHNRYAKTATFTLPGNLDLVAGVTVMLEWWGCWDGKYIIAQAKHTVNKSGHIMQIKLRRVLEGY